MSKGLKGSKNPKWLDVDVKKIKKMYLEDKMSLGRISKHFGCDRGVIKRRLESNGVKLVRHPRVDKAKDNTPAKNKLFYKYRMQAKRRNISFNLSIYDFLNIIENECYYCGNGLLNIEITTSGHTLKYNGIDRVDNSKGYDSDNVVSCCKICNKMKSDLDIKDFKNQIKKIHNHIL